MTEPGTLERRIEDALLKTQPVCAIESVALEPGAVAIVTLRKDAFTDVGVLRHRIESDTVKALSVVFKGFPEINEVRVIALSMPGDEMPPRRVEVFRVGVRRTGADVALGNVTDPHTALAPLNPVYHPLLSGKK